jgi:hypothetical protein
MTLNRWQAGVSTVVALGLISGVAAPLTVPAPAFAQSTFADVPANHWAKDFISALASRNIIKGFPDGTFRPNDPVTRAQFASLVRGAFNQPDTRTAINFIDVPSSHWAYNGIRDAYEMGFLSGYPGNIFNPEQNIPRAQVLVALANGLKYTVSGSSSTVLQTYTDAASIPDYALTPVAAATQKQIVVNYPNVNSLNPNQVATRADVAAFIYQALVSSGQATALSSPYIVGSTTTQPQQLVVQSGTVLQTKYDKSEKILLATNEPKPVPVTLTVAENVSVQNTVVIPAGSQVVGELQTVQGGAQFVAKELILANGTRTPISATSSVVTRTENITKGINLGKVLKNAALGAAAAAAIAAVTGDRAIATEEVLLGAGLSTVLTLIGVFQGRTTVDLISVDPNQDLDLTLKSDLVFRRAQ